MEYRDIQSGDLEQLSDFVIAIFKEVPDALWFKEPPSDEEMRQLLEQKVSGIKQRSLVDLVIEEEGEIIAECEIAKTVGNYGYLGILVRDDHRGKGLATKLFSVCAEKAKTIGITHIQAEVVETNDESIGFMKKIGFVEKKKEKNAEIHGQKYDLILFEKKL